MWSSHVMFTYDFCMWISHVTLTHDNHMWNSHMMFTCDNVTCVLSWCSSFFLKYRIRCRHVKFGIWFHMWTYWCSHVMFLHVMFTCDVHIWCCGMWCSHVKFTCEVWHVISHVNLLEDHMRFPDEMSHLTIFYLQSNPWRERKKCVYMCVHIFKKIKKIIKIV